MIVVDTNILSCMTFATEYSPRVTSLHEHDPVWEAPILWRTEFLNVLALYNRKNLIDYQDMLNALDLAERLIGTREHKVPSLDVVEAIVSSKCSSYDCEFITLAKSLGTYLITYDKKLLLEFPSIALRPEDYLIQIKK